MNSPNSHTHKSASRQSNHPQADSPQPHNRTRYLHAIACLVASVALALQLDFNNPQLVIAITSIFLVAYAALVYQLNQRLSSQKLQSIQAFLTYLDAGLVGLLITLSHFNLAIAIIFISLVQFRSLHQRGADKLLEVNIALAAGLLLSLLLYRPSWQTLTPSAIDHISLASIVIFFFAYALYLHQQANRQLQLNRQLSANDQQHRLKAHKLSHYLPPQVWEAIDQGREQQLRKTERKRITVFFSDIKDFSQMSEELEAETLANILNTYLSEMSKIVAQYGGTVDKFIGDGMMVIFGDRNSQGIKEDCLRCLSMTVAMRRRMKVLQQQWISQGIKQPLQIRMGVNTGYCTVGTFGTTDHMDYTALGTHVNLASRLESAAKPGGILISYESWSLVKEVVMCRNAGKIKVKGFSQPVEVYEVIDFRKDLGRNQNYFEKNTEGFAMHLDMDKIRNYEKDELVKYLDQLSQKLKDKVKF